MIEVSNLKRNVVNSFCYARGSYIFSFYVKMIIVSCLI